MADGVNYQGYYNPNMKLNDLEEKQNIIKDRLLLVGQNLIETKEETNEKIVELKKNLNILKEEVEKIRDFIETVSNELGKFAKKEDLEILSKQAKMFQPLEFVRKSDLKRLNQN